MRNNVVHLLPTAASTDDSVTNASVAVLPIGSFEQHGEHLPLTTDTLIACLIARELADAFDLLLLPPITVSCSHEHSSFTGTVSISATTLIGVVDDIRASLQHSGIDKLVLVNGHGGNYVLANIAQQANVDGRHVLLFPGSDDWRTARDHAGLESTSREDMHGGELETSILLHALPEVVRPSYKHADHTATDRPHLHLTGMAAYTNTGIIGRPSAATPEKGKASLDSLTTTFADHLKALLD
jgi:creatinine amidohydrolase